MSREKKKKVPCDECGKAIWRCSSQSRFHFCSKSCQTKHRRAQAERKAPPITTELSFEIIVREMQQLKAMSSSFGRLVDTVFWRIQNCRRGDQVGWGVLPLREAMALHVESVISYARGNKTKAARILQINTKTLYSLRKRYGLPIDRKNTSRPLGELSGDGSQKETMQESNDS